MHLVSKRKSVGLKHYNDINAFIEYSSDMVGIYENIEKYNPNKELKLLIMFDHIIAYMHINKHL